MQAYKLKFKSGFHIDDYGNRSYSQSQPFIHSDTLSSALLSVWALRRPERMREIIKSPPYLLSSAFPFYGKTFFLPLPKGRALIDENSFKEKPSEEDNIKKTLKKVQFIPFELWERLLRDSKYVLSADHFSFQEKTRQGKKEISKEMEQYYFSSSLLIPRGLFKTEKETELSPEEKKIWAEEDNERVSVNRLNNQAEEGQLFQFCRVHYPFERNDELAGGLYFLVQFPKKGDREQKEFEEILALLGDTGLGGDKNSGNGLFEFSKEKSCPIKTSYAEQPSFFCSLSLFCPNKTECQTMDWLEGGRYELKRRGGWIHNSSLRRKSLFMFSEGSCFKKSKNGGLEGEIANVTPEACNLGHDVFRDGRGLFIGYNETA